MSILITLPEAKSPDPPSAGFLVEGFQGLGQWSPFPVPPCDGVDRDSKFGSAI